MSMTGQLEWVGSCHSEGSQIRVSDFASFLASLGVASMGRGGRVIRVGEARVSCMGSKGLCLLRAGGTSQRTGPAGLGRAVRWRKWRLRAEGRPELGAKASLAKLQPQNETERRRRNGGTEASIEPRSRS